LKITNQKDLRIDIFISTLAVVFSFLGNYTLTSIYMAF